MDRGYSYSGQVRLGHSFSLAILVNWPHMFDNGPHLSPRVILSLGTFCPLGRFVSGTFVPGTFCPLGRFVPGTFCESCMHHHKNSVRLLQPGSH